MFVLSIIYWPIIQFNYHLWHLSSESPKKRQFHSTSIIDMGDNAVPLILDRLEHPYIFEEYYLLNCIAEITNIDSIKNFSNQEQLDYWKLWWKNNKDKY